MDKFSNISDVVVHIDPESHHHMETDKLPLRHEIVAQISECWHTLLDDTDIKNIDLHYLGRGIEVELLLTTGEVSDELARQLAEALRPIDSIHRIKICNNVLETSVVESFS